MQMGSLLSCRGHWLGAKEHRGDVLSGEQPGRLERSLGSAGAKLVLWLQNKIPLLIVSPSNINVYVFTLQVISAGQWQEHKS